MDPHFKDGFLIYLDDGFEISVPVRHIVKVGYSINKKFTRMNFTDSSFMPFPDPDKEFYNKAKKEMYTELHPELNFIKKLN